jgi:putative hemolysin
MTIAFPKGRYSARLAQGQTDVLACQRLRYLCFFGGEGVDVDAFDITCDHMMIHDQETAQLVCTFRLLHLDSGAKINKSYAAQYYDLAGLSSEALGLIEIGRFCCDPEILSPDVLRIAWAALTQIVDESGAKMLFGCSSFAGVDPAPYSAALGTLGARHLGAGNILPSKKSSEIIELADFPCAPRDGMRQMPPLLKTYLSMGGWVGDHVVVDRTMNTLHVFTGLFIKDVPEHRAKALRALVQTL